MRIYEKPARWGLLQLCSQEFNLHVKAFIGEVGEKTQQGFFGEKKTN